MSSSTQQTAHNLLIGSKGAAALSKRQMPQPKITAAERGEPVINCSPLTCSASQSGADDGLHQRGIEDETNRRPDTMKGQYKVDPSLPVCNPGQATQRHQQRMSAYE